MANTTNNRERQIERDRYYMDIARSVRGPAEGREPSVRGGAACLGSRVGAVLVRDDRIISTGYNGTPAGMPNCDETEKGCQRCQDRYWEKEGEPDKMSDPEHTAGKSLDRCLCVHAEQNALLTAARFGIAVEGATIYTTLSPCFTCLKGAVQSGIRRVVFETEYEAGYNERIADQYELMVDYLMDHGGRYSFELLGGTGSGASGGPLPDGD